MPKVTIDGRKMDVPSGRTVLEAARDAGITIPTLCYHKDLSVAGSCRLCLVEVEHIPRVMAACALPVSEGMMIHTDTPALSNYRRIVLEMLLSRYADAGYVPGAGQETEFQHWVRHYGARIPEGVEPDPRCAVDSDPNPFVWVDLNKCILCTRCVRACAEVQGRFVWV